jgi:hypothetical protein
VGEDAAKDMLAGIPDACEVLPGTGQMFGSAHPDGYGAAITHFVDEHMVTGSART